MMSTTHPVSSGLNSETTMQLSQSMDSVNTTPDEEVGLSLHYSLAPNFPLITGHFRNITTELSWN